MSEELKKAKVTFTGREPLHIEDENEQGASGPGDREQDIIRQLRATIRAYLSALEELLKGKYAHIKEWVPAYLSDPGNVMVVYCRDGVIIRFEHKVDKAHVLAAWVSETLPAAASMLSQRVINCYTDRNFTSTIPTSGTEIKLFKGSLTTGQEEVISSVRVGFDAVIEHPEQLPQPPHKPYCLLSVRNSFEIQILGILAKNGASIDEGQRFLTRSTVSLPVGWECIEIYPFFDHEQWKPEYAPVWAENDLLAAVVTQQYREAQFQSLDPNATARQQYGKLLKEYRDLLASNPDREEMLQSFLRDHPALLCPTQTKMWPKLPLGAHTTDFVFREATGDYLLVELEHPTHLLFLKDGHTSRDLNHAHGQIIDWKRYLEDNLTTVQRELGLTDISTNPRSLVVIGRSESLTAENRRKLISIENESPKVKIVTYDDVYDNAKAVIENLLGPIWDVVSNTQVYYLQGIQP